MKDEPLLEIRDLKTYFHSDEGTAKAVAIYAAGRTFVAGADIREFGKPFVPPALPDVFNIIEASAIPVISVLHGTALGGGLEAGVGGSPLAIPTA